MPPQYLSVYAPPAQKTANASSGGYAVWLYIYGGDFSLGGANDRQLFGDRTVKEVGDVVVVVPNWRQGLFGGLGGAELQKLSSDGSTGNWGHKDQRMAMKWVQANIKAFGGDPTRVFVFGESCGACAVSAHLTSPKSWGLFSRAGIQSGSFTRWGYKTMEQAQGNFDYFATL